MSALLSCPQGHKWWAPFTDGPDWPGDGRSACPRCGNVVELPQRPASPPPGPPPPAPPGPPPNPATMVTAQVELNISGTPLKAAITVPAGPTRPQELLPVFWKLTNTIVDLGVKAVEAQGKTITCQKGCGACCRQLVPIAESEARQVRDLVHSLPEPRRTEVQARFAEARRRLEEAGLLDALLHPERFNTNELNPLGLRYFHQGIPCPFLDAESCSIHPERPTACREYLVTSPAVHCADPSPETVRCVEIAGKVSAVLMRLEADPAGPFARWVPLVLAPAWADAHPDEAPPRSGKEVLTEFFQRLAEKRGPAPAAPEGKTDG